MSKEKLTLAYAGKDVYKRYFVGLAFGDSAVEEYIGMTWVWRNARILRKKGSDCCLMVSDVLRDYRKLFIHKKCFYIPAWVGGGTDSSSNLTRSAKSDIQKLKKNKMHCEVTDEPAAFDRFYHDMHVPYIKNVYGDQAIIFSYEDMRNKFGRRRLYNALFFLKNERNETLASVLVGYKKNALHLYFLGVKEGDYDLVKEGVVGILFSYPVLYAKEKGYAWVDFGWSRPFLKDGALNFKKKRGMHIVDIFEKGYVLRPISKSAGLMNFLANNPFLYGDRKSLRCALFMDRGQSLSAEDFSRIYSDHYMDGISQFTIYFFGGVPAGTRGAVPPDLWDKFSFESADGLF